METRFYLKKTKNKKEATILFQFSEEYGKIKISSGLKIKINDWGIGFPKKNVRTKEICKTLNNWKFQIDDYINYFIRTQKRKPTKHELGNYINDLIKGVKTNPKTIATLIDEFLNYQKNELAKGTIRYKKIQLNHFGKFINANKLTTVDLTEDVIYKYRTKLINEKRENTTTNKYISTVKTFLNWLRLRNYMTVNLSEFLIKTKEVKKDVIALNLEEVSIIENAILEPRLQRQLDVFLVGCYTALSISDLKRINKESIQNGFIVIRRRKTGKLLKIPILSKAERILSKYDYKLPCISDNKGNEVLKEIFTKLNLNRKVTVTRKVNNETVDIVKPLNEVISWHKARKTAITLALNRGMPPHYVMQMATISKFDTLQKYIEYSDQNLKQQMFDKLE